MKKLLTLLILFSMGVWGQNKKTKEENKEMELLMQELNKMDSISKALKPQTGIVKLPNGVATITVPEGYYYLNAEQASLVLEKAWGNPPEVSKCDGMLYPKDINLVGGDETWAFIINYESMGYVKDDDADDIDYAEMMDELKKDTETANSERKAMGYDNIHIIGWASAPYYDKTKKVLHWAKEVQFGDTTKSHTLNYDVRVLGRKGVLSMNAVGSLGMLKIVKNDIPKILASATFDAGNRYEDFDSGIDNVAAYTIGGLVAGKVLAKVGFFAVLLKFWKIAAVAIVAGFTAIKKFFTRGGD